MHRFRGNLTLAQLETFTPRRCNHSCTLSCCIMPMHQHACKCVKTSVLTVTDSCTQPTMTIQHGVMSLRGYLQSPKSKYTRPLYSNTYIHRHTSACITVSPWAPTNFESNGNSRVGKKLLLSAEASLQLRISPFQKIPNRPKTCKRLKNTF